MKFLSELSDKTVIPVGFAIFLIGGAAAWMTSVDSRLAAHAASQDRHLEAYQRIIERLDKITDRLTVIETKLDSRRR